MNTYKLSKFLSLVLRHDPASIGITLDPQGWVECTDLIAASIAHGMPPDQEREAVMIGR
jgi:putative RNA 2'-phosphotransferase